MLGSTLMAQNLLEILSRSLTAPPPLPVFSLSQISKFLKRTITTKNPTEDRLSGEQGCPHDGGGGGCWQHPPALGVPRKAHCEIPTPFAQDWAVPAYAANGQARGSAPGGLPLGPSGCTAGNKHPKRELHTDPRSWLATRSSRKQLAPL